MAAQKPVPVPGHAQRPAVQPSPGRHAVPHIPQLVGSVCTSTQRLIAEQNVRPVPGHEHRPARHDWPAGQVVPHAPQLVGSV